MKFQGIVTKLVACSLDNSGAKVLHFSLLVLFVSLYQLVLFNVYNFSFSILLYSFHFLSQHELRELSKIFLTESQRSTSGRVLTKPVRTWKVSVISGISNFKTVQKIFKNVLKSLKQVCKRLKSVLVGFKQSCRNLEGLKKSLSTLE